MATISIDAVTEVKQQLKQNIMAITGTLSVNGISISSLYVKLRIGSISEVMQPVYDHSEPPVQTGEEKVFVVNYNYEYKKDSECLPIFESSKAVECNINENLYSQCYTHLAAQLSISATEV